MLKLMPKKGAGVISQAAQLGGRQRRGRRAAIDVDAALRSRDCSVDDGPIVKRWMPRSMGRANRINHRTSHVTVVVTDEKS